MEPEGWGRPNRYRVNFRHSIEGGQGKQVDRSIQELGNIDDILNEYNVVLGSDFDIDVGNNPYGKTWPKPGSMIAYVDKQDPNWINLLPEFYGQNVNDRAVTLGHEMLHNVGVDHWGVPGGFTPRGEPVQGLTGDQGSWEFNKGVRRVIANRRRIPSVTR